MRQTPTTSYELRLSRFTTYMLNLQFIIVSCDTERSARCMNELNSSVLDISTETPCTYLHSKCSVVVWCVCVCASTPFPRWKDLFLVNIFHLFLCLFVDAHGTCCGDALEHTKCSRIFGSISTHGFGYAGSSMSQHVLPFSPYTEFANVLVTRICRVHRVHRIACRLWAIQGSIIIFRYSRRAMKIPRSITRIYTEWYSVLFVYLNTRQATQLIVDFIVFIIFFAIYSIV